MKVILMLDLYIIVPVFLFLSSAAKQAGFNILRMISEPSAAVLAYDLGQSDSYNG